MLWVRLPPEAQKKGGTKMYPKLQKRGFVPIVPWNQVEALLDQPGELERFKKWLNGQTLLDANGGTGVFPWDLERFLAGLPIID